MRILFWGNKKSNLGPDNVNKCIINNLTDKFWCVKSGNKYGELLEGLWKLLFSRVVVVSGMSKKGCILFGIARMLRKKKVYIMHGCAAYECELNEANLSKRDRTIEQYLLKYADMLLPVSKKFMYWVHDRYPQYACKTKFLYNGIEKEGLISKPYIEKIPNSVIAAGGNDKLKGNSVVSEAIDAMEGSAYFEIYGGLYDSCSQKQYRYVRCMGRVSHEQFVQKLAQAELFVLNSIFETFSIAAIEALMCGCSILISEAAGITDLLELEETDIIHNPMDPNEIKSKIAYLLEHPNNERILSKLDIDEWSYEKSVERLEKLCAELC